jgi:hypothetical protein
MNKIQTNQGVVYRLVSALEQLYDTGADSTNFDFARSVASNAIKRGKAFLVTGAGGDYDKLKAERDELLEALKQTQRLIDEALPKFNWGNSALDANAISLLNSVPLAVNAAIAKAEGGAL